LQKIVFLFFGWPGLALASSQSARLDNFNIQNCAQARCYVATAKQSFVSNDGTMLAGENLVVEFTYKKDKEIRNKALGNERKLTCQSFAYANLNKNLLCENKNSTLIIDSNLNVETIKL
jgi:hypothetical protein